MSISNMEIICSFRGTILNNLPFVTPFMKTTVRFILDQGSFWTIFLSWLSAWNRCFPLGIFLTQIILIMKLDQTRLQTFFCRPVSFQIFNRHLAFSHLSPSWSCEVACLLALIWALSMTLWEIPKHCGTMAGVAIWYCLLSSRCCDYSRNLLGL